MYCKKCGKENEKNSKFCVDCGTALKEKKQRASDAPAVSTGWKVLCFTLPLVFLLGAGVFLFFAHEKEQGINRDVLIWQEDMAEAVTEGDLEKAVTLNEQALASRPKESAFREDQKQLDKAVSWHDDQEGIVTQIEELEFEKAEEGLESLSQQVNNFESPLSELVAASLEQTETSLFLTKTREEIKEMESVEQLGSKLSALENYEGEEAATLADNVRSKLENISYEDASEQLNNGNMDGAEQVLHMGMEYVPDSEKLLSLQEEVEAQRLAAERAEQARREQQLKQAAAEDRKNRTEAAEVIALDSTIDYAGDLNIEGQVKNNGTTSISSVEVTLDVYEEGAYLGETTLYVTPYSLAPGETGSFYDFYIGPFYDVEVELVEVTWYVN